MSQKTLNLCLERYNFVKFGETTKSSHTVLCTNNAYSVNSDKYRLTPTAIASKHGEGYVFTLNYDFDRPLFTIVQKSYSLDGTSGNIVFEGIDPISKGGSKYLRRVEVSPVKLSDGSYLLEVTKDEYLRIGTTGAALGDEDLESLNEKIVATGGIMKSVETVGGKQVLKLDAGGPSGVTEIVYFDIDPSDPPSGLYNDIGTALSSNKLPAIRSDGKLYMYSSTGTDRYVFVGAFSTDDVGYEEFSVYSDDNVQADKCNASLGYAALPSSGTEEHPAWAKVCELEPKPQQTYTTYGLALLFTAENPSDNGKNTESGILAIDVGSNWFSNSNSCNASWMAYTPGSEYAKILGVKIIGKYGLPSNPALAPYPIYKIEVWVKYYSGHDILVNALQNAMCFTGMVQGDFFKFPEGHIAIPQSTEPSYADTEEYKYKEFFYHAQAPTDGSCLLTPVSDFQTLDGTTVILRYVWPTGTPTAVTGDKIRLATKEGETKYRVEVAALGAYRIDLNLYVKWDGTPVNRIGRVFGFPLDFSRNFEAIVGRMSNIMKAPLSEQEYYGFGFRIGAGDVDVPNGVKLAIQAIVEYIGPVPEET